MSSNIHDNEEWIYGYKIFTNDSYWKNNQNIELGKIYVHPMTWNNCGFHFCKNIEDTFFFYRYDDNASVYQVCGSGQIITYENDYYGIYDVYAVEKLKIIREVSRDEIIRYFLAFKPNFHSDRLLRFIQLFSLTEEEIQLFKDRFQKLNQVIRYINYYHEGDKEAFVKKLSLY